MKYFAAVVLLAAAASAATVPVYQSPSVVVPSGNVVRTEPVSTTYFRSGVVSHGPAAAVPVASVAYPQAYQPYVAASPARPVAYAAAQPVAYAAHAQPVAYAAADYVHPAGYGYVAQPAYVAPAVHV